MDHCPETRARIRLAVAAWAYEHHDDPLMNDDEFDRLALTIDVRKSTSRPDLDEFFRQHFNPSTVMWVLNHPDKAGLERIYQMVRGGRPCRWEVILSRVMCSTKC